MAAGTAVAIAIVIAAIVSYLVVRNQLQGQVDDALRAQAAAVVNRGAVALGTGLADVPPNAGGPAPYWQIVAQNGEAMVPAHSGVQLPFDSATQRVARQPGTAIENV